MLNAISWCGRGRINFGGCRGRRLSQIWCCKNASPIWIHWRRIPEPYLIRRHSYRSRFYYWFPIAADGALGIPAEQIVRPLLKFDWSQFYSRRERRCRRINCKYRSQEQHCGRWLLRAESADCGLIPDNPAGLSGFVKRLGVRLARAKGIPDTKLDPRVPMEHLVHGRHVEPWLSIQINKKPLEQNRSIVALSSIVRKRLRTDYNRRKILLYRQILGHNSRWIQDDYRHRFSWVCLHARSPARVEFTKWRWIVV